MRSYTHIAAAILFYMILAFLLELGHFLLGLILAAWISVFPDLVDRLTGKHRGIGHSLLWFIPFSSLFIFNVDIGAAILVGFLSHLFMDTFTVHGCPALYPILETNFVCLAKKRRIKTGTKMDKAVFVFLIFLIVPAALFATGNHALIIGDEENSTAFATRTSPTTSSPYTIKNDVTLNFRLDEATNKNVTVEMINENMTTILVKDLDPGG